MSIKIIAEPKVYLVGRQQVDESELQRFLDDEDVSHWATDTEVGAERLVESSGRLCYMSFARPRPGGNKAYINRILEVGHGSVLEHAVFNLIITGVSRSFTHELVRHRAGWGFSQLSQRFVDESQGGLEVVVPPALRDEVDAAIGFYGRNAITLRFDGYADAFDRCTPAGPDGRKVVVGLRWLAAMERARDDYAYFSDYLHDGKLSHLDDRTLRRKKAREAARSVLPNATETKIFVTANGRALRHFIEMRADPAADAEIRRVAVATLQALQGEAPNLFGDYTIADLPDGTQAATTPHRKV